MDQGFAIKADPARGTASSLVMGRLKRLKNIEPATLDEYPSGDVVEARIRDFVEVNGLDDACNEKLLASDLEVALQVMDAGFVLQSGNPSANVTRRLRDYGGSGD